jgi:hypothetical protein
MTDACASDDVYAPPMLRRLGIAIACAIFCLAPIRAQATVVKAMTLQEKTQASPLVVHAIVERIETEWEVPGARARTLITLSILEILKGDAAPGQRIIVHQTGGRIGDFHQTASGLSKYEEGEECVLFLEPLGPYLVELGVGIGKYAIESVSGERWVKFAPNVVAFRKVEGERGHVERVPPMEPELLRKFLKRVRSYVENIPTGVSSPRKGATLRTVPR